MDTELTQIAHIVYTKDESESAIMSFQPYTILETEIGPMISQSRTSVYDVLITQNEGEDFDSICVIHNLRPMQVEVALAYIEKHRAELEAKLPQLLAKKAEQERYHRTISTEREKIIRDLPLTAERAEFYALRDKNRQLWDLNGKDLRTK